MRRLDGARLWLLALLGIGCVVLAVRIFGHAEDGGRLVAELGRAPVTRIDPRTREVLRALEGKLFLTYYVSGAKHMPSHMRRVEREVTDLFRALEAAAPGKVSYQIVDPASVPELAGFSARRRIAPFRTRSVTRDAYDERTVWSSIAISHGTREVLLDGIVPERVPALQRVIVEHLVRLERPVAPVLALDAPRDASPDESLGGFEELADALAERGELVRVDLAAGDPFPTEADVLFWMRPTDVQPRRLLELERFLASGRCAVVAGSALRPDGNELARVDGEPAILLAPAPEALTTVLARWGLAPIVELVGDERCSAIRVDGEERPAPFRVRCIAPNQDFRGWRSQANGHLLFDFPTPFAVDPEALRDRGYEPRVRATTSDATWIQEPPLARPLPLARIAREEGSPVAKLPLLVELVPDDPWRGSLLAAAASTPFEDGWLSAEGVAHRRLLQTLLDHTTDPLRLARNAAAPRPAAPLPELPFSERLALRGLVVFLLPAASLVLFLRRREPRVGPHRTRRDLGRSGLLALSAGALGLLGVRLVRLAEDGLDLTRDDRNRIAPESASLCRDLLAERSIRCELVLSASDRLPPTLRRLPARLRRLLDEFRDAGADLEVGTLDPDGRDDELREALRAKGVVPARFVVRDEETTSVRRAYASLLLEAGDRTEVVSLADERADEELEFRTLFALWRLATDRRPHVAFASDVPRLSAAEAYEDYQQKGLFAPKGTDVYAGARRLLEESGYRVTHVDPSKPDPPPDIDALVWLQPRRRIDDMLEASLRYLCAGGNVLLAAQHFNVQSRQYRGAEFDVVHWPQPQTPEVERFYFPDVGIRLVREVLFDERSFASEIDSQLTGRSGTRELQRHQTALPFLVRASSANMDPDSPITRDLGDLAFAWPNWLATDGARLAELGIRARPLIETSERTWSFPWEGGWIPDEALAGPPRDETLGRLPLAVLFEGPFPAPELPFEPRATADEDAPAEPWPSSKPGRLLFVAGSELFKDGYLASREFRSDHLLANAVAALALEPELAAVAARRRVARGFDFVPEAGRLRWRTLVVASGPVLLLVVGGLITALRRRSPLVNPGGVA